MQAKRTPRWAHLPIDIICDTMTNNGSPTRLLVLGGGSDIATAFVQRCASNGLSEVVLAGRPGGSLDQAARTLREHAPQVELATAVFDGAASRTHQDVIQAIDEKHGPFDTVLVAFGQLGDPFTIDIDPAQAAALAEVNFAGSISATLAGLNILRGEPNATLVVISSIAAVRPRVGNLIYGASKAGLDAFVTELTAPANEVGVRVVLVRPGFVHTRMTEGLEPAPFATTAAEVASDMFDGLVGSRSVIHSPAVLAGIGPVLKNLPGPLWRRVAQ